MILLVSLLPSKGGGALQSADIVILTPGYESVVFSPIEITAGVKPGADNLIRVSLIDQRNNLLSRQLIRVEAQPENTAQFSTKLAFEIPTERAKALLALETRDEYNRPISLRAIPLTLTSEAEVVLQPQPFEEPWLTITAPEASSTHGGGLLQVTGRVTPISAEPIVFELITDSGGVIGSKKLGVNTVGEELTFDIIMTYGFINATRDVRLVIRQALEPFDVTIALDSIPFFLGP